MKLSINNIYVERVKLAPFYKMPTLDVHSYYSVSLIISGDRKLITHDGIYFIHAREVSFIDKDLYHRTESISNIHYEKFAVHFTYNMVQRLIPYITENYFKQLMTCISSPLLDDGYYFVYDIFCKMLEEYNNPSIASELILEGNKAA